MQITMTSIFVDDPIKAHDFYTIILGFQSKEFVPDAQLAVVVSPDDPNGTALLLEPGGESFGKEYQEQVYNAGLPVIVFGAKTLSDAIKRLKDRGVKFRDDLKKNRNGAFKTCLRIRSAI